MKNTVATLIAVPLLAGRLGCSAPLTTREKGAGIGALGGAAAGGIIGSAVGRSGAGAAIGGALRLGSGALIGDQLKASTWSRSGNSGKSTRWFVFSRFGVLSARWSGLRPGS